MSQDLRGQDKEPSCEKDGMETKQQEREYQVQATAVFKTGKHDHTTEQGGEKGW